MSSKKSLIITLLTYFGFILFVYLHNLSRSVYGGDVGDLITASKVLGVAHPPGYPLFTLLGFILTRIDLISPAFMTGLISALSSAISVIIFFLISLHLTKNRSIAFISSLILAFNYQFWFYSEIAEVFALNNLFILLLFLFALKLREKNNKKFLFLLSLTAGLSLTNHQTIILVFPAILVLVYKDIFKFIKKPKILFSSFLLFILGMSVYVYVPIAASFNPPVNWDHVKDLDSFLRLVLRQDYGTFSAGTFEKPILLQRLIILKTYFSSIFLQLTLPVVLLSFFGGISLFIKDKKLLISLLIGFILTGPFFIAYAGFPLLNSFYVGVYERFFIMSTVVFMLFFPMGLLGFIKIINKLFKKDLYEPLFLLVFLLIPISLFYYNFPKTNLSNIFAGDRMAYDLVSPLPKNSVLLLSGDTALFNVWYIHFALNFRPDIHIININGLDNDAYFKSEQKKYLAKYPKDIKDKDVNTKIIGNIAKSRPIFSYITVEPSKGKKFIWVPYGLTYKLVLEENEVPGKEEFLKQTQEIWAGFRKPSLEESKSPALSSLTIAGLPAVYADALLETGNFLISKYSDTAKAYEYFNKALEADSTDYKVHEVLGVYYLSQKDCGKAKDSLNKSISINPLEKTSYYLMYLTFSSCFKDTNMQKKIISDYNNTFKSDFTKDYKITNGQLKK